MTGKLDPWYRAREHVRNALERDLMGTRDDEILDEPPLDRFVVGILYPRDDRSLEEEADLPEAAIAAGADAVFDPAVALSRVRYPSSMGVTFALSHPVSSLTVDVTAARYRPGPIAEGAAPADDSVQHRRGKPARAQQWVREDVERGSIALDVSNPGPVDVPVADGLRLAGVVRAPRDGSLSVTVVLVNELKAKERPARDEASWFQPRLVFTADGSGFQDRVLVRPSGVEDEDLDGYELLFRDVRNLAVGHGCSVLWEDAPNVRRLETSFVPRHDVLVAEPSGGPALSMATLASGSDLEPVHTMLTAYRHWITDREAEVDGLPTDLAATARVHLASAADAADRIEQGIRVLESDDVARRAFALMNSAMNEQRNRQDRLRSVTPRRQQSWRPFQMAFILLNLVGVTDASSKDRDLADLLWFPTGGGKTEAYLGLIGYTILLRRLRRPADGGVSVLMRYTLRLLTVQQFERAAGLICALELLRRRELPDAAPISLGLWVGQAATPNNVKDAKKALLQLKKGEEGEHGNPMQLLRCPWCGVHLSDREYQVDKAVTRMTVRCASAVCEYSSALPVHLVDEDVYRERPSLVIGTVDKFAMMAWRSEVSNLFSTDRRHSAPDLIVQDELHLISGPLGTMVGLYEAAVDAACSVGGTRPKLVASTATIRRARKQVKAVYDREARQFPPPGLTARDSFFSVQASRDDRAAREYVGVLAPGVSQATLLVRAYAAVLHAAQTLEADDAVRDAYWTLLGYFNSLRVLGGAFMQVIDDVPDRLKVLAERDGSPAPRELAEPREMTSRKRSSEIPFELEMLGTSLPDEQTPDVVLATNMISVGVDVDRLGLMVVMGQPQMTAEYIQATSRVGRQHPGLVVVLYNSARSRDLSHYESFASYHRALYRQVEATGATPFAARARDRGLHGVLVAMTRLLVSRANPDGSAGDISSWADEVRRLRDDIVTRARSIAPDEADATARQLDAIIEHWKDGAPHTNKYAGWFDTTGALLAQAGRSAPDEDLEFPVGEPPWPTLTSLRDVDVESSLFLMPSKGWS